MVNPVDTFFSELTDPRSGRNIQYPLEEILLVAVVSMLCGGETYEDMSDIGSYKLDFLRRYYPFKKGIPSEDTFRYVFMLMDPKSFGDCFARWMSFLHAHVEGLVAIDGKACRGSSKSKKSSPLNIVNAYCHERGVVLACIDTPSKSNEITVLPELLKMLDIKGCTVTLDAMGCQKAIAAQIIQQKGDYLISLKGNQGNLHHDVAEFFDAHEQTSATFEEPDFKADVFEYEDRSHGRHYRRKVVASSDFCGGLSQYKKSWKGLRTVARLDSWRTQEGQCTHEVRYFITSAAANAEELANAMRGHWAIENNAHWMLDVYFGEDASRVRSGHAAKILAILRRFILNMARKAQQRLPKRKSIRRIRRACALNEPSLEDALAHGLKLYPVDSNA